MKILNSKYAVYKSMNKLGIWAIAIVGAFVIGILSANPVVEAVGGWQAAIAGHETRITDLENQELPFNARYLVYEDTACTSSGGHPVHIDQGWCPNGVRTSFAIFDAGVDLDSIVLGQNKATEMSFDSSGQLNGVDGCGLRVLSVDGFPDGLFLFSCTPIPDGTELRLLVIDPPTP